MQKAEAENRELETNLGYNSENLFQKHTHPLTKQTKSPIRPLRIAFAFNFL